MSTPETSGRLSGVAAGEDGAVFILRNLEELVQHAIPAASRPLERASV
jgi:hypothetical protein